MSDKSFSPYDLGSQSQTNGYDINAMGGGQGGASISQDSPYSTLMGSSPLMQSNHQLQDPLFVAQQPQNQSGFQYQSQPMQFQNNSTGQIVDSKSVMEKQLALKGQEFLPNQPQFQNQQQQQQSLTQEPPHFQQQLALNQPAQFQNSVPPQFQQNQPQISQNLQGSLQQPMIQNQNQNSLLSMGGKTSEEREETMKRIIKKQYRHILDPKERDSYELVTFKVQNCRYFSNAVLALSIWKFFSTSKESQQVRRLALFRMLVLQMGCFGISSYFVAQSMQLRKGFQEKYLAHMSDKHLDDLLLGAAVSQAFAMGMPQSYPQPPPLTTNQILPSDQSNLQTYAQGTPGMFENLEGQNHYQNVPKQ